jgi:hypothetical protein
MSKKLIEYTVLKAVQVLALFVMAFAMVEDYNEGSWWVLFSTYVWTMFVRDAVTNKLENKYIIDTL